MAIPGHAPPIAPLAFPALLIGAAALAVGPVFVRTADVSPIASAFYRMALAAPVLVALALATGQRWPARRGWGVLAFAGVLFAVDIAAWHLGIVRTTLGNAVLFGNVSSFFFAGYGFLLARAWPTRRFGAAMVVAAVGVTLLLGRSFELSATHFIGDLLCVAAAIAYTAYLAVMDKARASVGAIPALAVATVVGAIALAPFAVAMPSHFVPHHWTPLILLAFGSQVFGQGLVIYAVGHLKPAVSGLGLLIQPVIAAAIGWAWFSEVIGAVDALGAVLILGSLAAARWPGRKATLRRF